MASKVKFDFGDRHVRADQVTSQFILVQINSKYIAANVTVEHRNLRV